MTAVFSRRTMLAAAATASSLYGAGLLGASPSLAATNPLSKNLASGAMSAVTIHNEIVAVPRAPFKTEAGDEMVLADLKGRALLVNFWATWCAPCLKEMPSINALAGQMADKPFKVVAISLDRGSPARSRAFLDKIGATHLELYVEPTMSIAREMRVVGLPVSVLIDAEGREVARLTGHAEWDTREAQALAQAVVDLSTA